MPLGLNKPKYQVSGERGHVVFHVEALHLLINSPSFLICLLFLLLLNIFDRHFLWRARLFRFDNYLLLNWGYFLPSIPNLIGVRFRNLPGFNHHIGRTHVPIVPLLVNERFDSHRIFKLVPNVDADFRGLEHISLTPILIDRGQEP